MPALTQKEAEQVIKKLNEIEAKIDDIQRSLDVMMQIHEQLHPEALERARREVEGSEL